MWTPNFSQSDADLIKQLAPHVGPQQRVSMKVKHKSSNTLYSLFMQLFERRSKVVKNACKKELWKHVKPEMMSEEEDGGDGSEFVRHRFTWRSKKKLNQFIEKLDKRSSKRNTKVLAKKRVYGDPLKSLL